MSTRRSVRLTGEEIVALGLLTEEEATMDEEEMNEDQELRLKFAQAAYYDQSLRDNELEGSFPVQRPWVRTIRIFNNFQGRLVRKDHLEVSVTGTLYFDDHRHAFGSLMPHELAMIESDPDDPNDIPDPLLLLDKIERPIFTLKRSLLRLYTLPQYEVDPWAILNESKYAHFKQGLHSDIVALLQEKELDVYVNPAVTAFNEQDWRRASWVEMPVHRITHSYWAMKPSSEEGRIYAQTDDPRPQVGFTGYRDRDKNNACMRTGFFMMFIPRPPKEGEEKKRGRIIFAKVDDIEMMLASYCLYLITELPVQAIRYGIKVPTEAMEYAWSQLGEQTHSSDEKEEEDEAEDVDGDDEDDDGDEGEGTPQVRSCHNDLDSAS